jgi:hypothetical protein
MFLEFAMLIAILAFFPLVFIKNGKYLKLVIICMIVLCGVGLVGNDLSWKHYIKSVRVENKTIIQRIPFVSEKVFGGNDGIVYNLNDNINYSRIEANKTYVIDASYNDDFRLFYNGPWTQWVDKMDY